MHDCNHRRCVIAGGKQHDSQEFCTHLLQWLHEDLNVAATTTNRAKVINPISELHELDSYYPKVLDDHEGRNQSMVDFFFMGVACKINKCTNNKPPILSLKLTPTFPQQLQLAVAKEKKDIGYWLQQYFAEKNFEGWKHDNEKFTKECKKGGHTTQLKLFKTAPFLIINLKRYAKAGGSMSKNETKVTFPATNELDLSPYFEKAPSAATGKEGRFDRDQAEEKEAQTEGCVYTLRAFSLHSGDTKGGHYVAYARGWGESEEWWLCNDSRVTPVKTEQQWQNFEKARDTGYVYFFQQKKPIDLNKMRAAYSNVLATGDSDDAGTESDGDSILESAL